MTLRFGPLTLPYTDALVLTSTLSPVVLTLSLVLRLAIASAEASMPPEAENVGAERAAPAPAAGAIDRTVAVRAKVAPAATTETRVLFMGLIMHRSPTG